jgi:hypothetical protein
MRSLLTACVLVIISLGATSAKADEKPVEPVPLPVGEHIPSFSVPDQHGKVRSFENLTGPKGLVLFFHKSAEW